MRSLKNAITTIKRYQHRFATIAFVVGFVIDVVTFRTLNLTIAVLILVAHLVIVAVSMAIIAAPVTRDSAFMRRVRAFAPITYQYSTGSLLSPFFVLYSASGSLSASWPFLLIVVAAAIGNETVKLKDHLLAFQSTVFFFNLALFGALAAPLVLDSMGTTAFLAGIGGAWLVFALYVRIARYTIKGPFKTEGVLLRSLAGSVAALLIFFYFTNLIPPIPLAVKSAGFYHAVTQHAGTFTARDEVHPWYALNTELHLAIGERAYVFVAVFAPASIDTTIVHRWERWDSAASAWVTVQTITIPIEGGRPRGYRGYSYLDAPIAGRYRVSVETARGAVLGRFTTTITRVTTPVPTASRTLE